MNTEKLKALAKQLGIDVPDDVSKEKLTELIQERQKEIQKQIPKEKIIIYAIFSFSYLRNDTFMN